jgi:PAS domain-containing protein
VSALKRSVLAAGRRRRAQIVIGPAHYDCTLDPIRGAGTAIEALACVAFDITEHKRVEADLRRSRALLAEAEHLARIGSWEWDIGQNHVSWSNGLFEIYGIDPARFDHRYQPGSQRVHPDDRARVDATVQAARERARHSVPAELREAIAEYGHELGSVRSRIKRLPSERAPSGTRT